MVVQFGGDKANKAPKHAIVTFWVLWYHNDVHEMCLCWLYNSQTRWCGWDLSAWYAMDNGFSIPIQIRRKFPPLSPWSWYNDRDKILYMARQLYCRGMCKYLLRSDDQTRNYSKAKFPSNLNWGSKIVWHTARHYIDIMPVIIGSHKL